MRNTRRNGTRNCIGMHQEVLGTKTGQHVDHKNHDTLDNRRANLRQCTTSQNIRHQKKHKNNASGFKGVYFYAKTNKWCAQICLNRKAHYLGRHASAELASTCLR